MRYKNIYQFVREFSSSLRNKAIGEVRQRLRFFFITSLPLIRSGVEPTDIKNHRVIKQVLDENLSYLDLDALLELYLEVKKVKTSGRPGVIIEAGCGLGGSSLLITSAKEKSRRFYIYDVFGMIPSPTEEDEDKAQKRYEEIISGESSGCGNNKYYGYEKDLIKIVEGNFSRFGLSLSQNNIEIIKGLFEDRLNVNESVALAHIDCDWFDSVFVCLQRIVPHLTIGGVLIIDDYFTWPGCKKAVDTYFVDLKSEFEFIRKHRLHIVRIKR